MKKNIFMKGTHILRIVFFGVVSSLVSGGIFAQGMAVNTTGAPAATSAVLDVSSTAQGVLLPSMTAAQRSAIGSPATGLLVYQTDGSAGFYYFNGTAWTALNTPAGTAGGDLSGTYPDPALTTTGVTAATYGSATASPVVSVDAKGRVTAASNTAISGVVPGGAAGGNLSGTYPNPSVASLPAISGTALTSLTAGNLSGTLPAISGANLTSLNAGNISTGTVNTARLGTGATASNYLSGNGTWQTISGGSGGYVFSGSCQTSFALYYTGLVTGSNTSNVALGQDIVSAACTLDAFYVHIKSYGTGTSTIPYSGTVYVNGSATSMTVSGSVVSAGNVVFVGTNSDLSHPVTLAAGDKVAIKWTQTVVSAVLWFTWTIHAH
jgi:hypothetical protein